MKEQNKLAGSAVVAEGIEQTSSVLQEKLVKGRISLATMNWRRRQE